MERRRRWLASLLALVLAVGLLPTAAWAEEKPEDTGMLPAEPGNAILSEEPTPPSTYSDEIIVTRAILADLIYQDATLKGVIGSNTSEFGFSDIGADTGVTESQREAINAIANARFISGIK